MNPLMREGIGKGEDGRGVDGVRMKNEKDHLSRSGPPTKKLGGDGYVVR